jgi:hypothetical protein
MLCDTLGGWFAAGEWQAEHMLFVRSAWSAGSAPSLAALWQVRQMPSAGVGCGYGGAWTAVAWWQSQQVVSERFFMLSGSGAVFP